jgi:DNA-directed RNA polymerase, mitochondrial
MPAQVVSCNFNTENKHVSWWCRGIAFAGVHDSFWTHAADVDSLRTEIRTQFVHLYMQPLLERLRDDMQKSLDEVGSGERLPDLPPRGELDLNDVLKSTYFFN